MNVTDDQVTLAIAAWGAATGTLGLYLGRRDSRWKRRHASMAPLREALEELAPPIRNSTDPQVLRGLFSVTSGAHIEALRTGLEQVPDVLCRRHLAALVTALTTFRGGRQEDRPDGTPAALTKSQLSALKEAKIRLAKVEKRLNTTAKKGRS